MATEGTTVHEPVEPAGLKLAYEVMTAAEEAELIALVEDSGLSYLIYDPGNRRASTSYGWKYKVTDDSFLPCAELPAGFRAIAAKAAALVGLEPADLAECLLNRYEPGAVIQPHCDKPVWEHVVGVSLGTATTMRFRHSETGEEIPVHLPRRSMYVLAGDARYVWQHGLPPIAETRWSITFRSFSAEGLRRLKACAEAI